MISCPNCGKDIADDAAHCGHCGHKVEVGSKKTMMGFGGAVDADALRAKLDKAKKEEQDGGGGASLPRPSGGAEDASGGGEEAPDMAPTQLMDSVDLPTPGGGDDEEGDVSELETAPTEMMDQPEASDFDEFEDDDAFAATKAMSTVESPKVSAPEDSADDAVDSDTDSDTGGRWQIDDGAADESVDAAETADEGQAAPDAGGGGIEIDLGEVEGGGVVVDDEAPGEAAGESAEVQTEDADSGPAGGRDLMQMRKGADAEAGASEEAGDGDAVAGMDDYLDEDDDDGEGPDQKMLIIGGVVAVLLLGCCGAGTLMAVVAL